MIKKQKRNKSFVIRLNDDEKKILLDLKNIGVDLSKTIRFYLTKLHKELIK